MITPGRNVLSGIFLAKSNRGIDNNGYQRQQRVQSRSFSTVARMRLFHAHPDSNRSAFGRRLSFGFERLEARQLLSASPVITEFQARNRNTIFDADGDSSDWIEIANLGDETIDLAGWYLTDNRNRLDKWQFPTTVLEPGEYLVVFASTKDRAVPGEELHTNFALAGDGEYLALIEPDGRTVASDFGDRFPVQLTGASYGLVMETESDTLVSEGAEALVWPATDNRFGSRWTGGDEPFDDSAWTVVELGVGYDLGENTELTDLIAFWPFDSTPSPAGPGGLPATIFEATYSTDVPGPLDAGKSLRFDGVNDEVHFGDVGMTRGTISLWLKPNRLADDMRLFAPADGTTACGGAPRITADGRLDVWNGGAWLPLAPAGSIRAGEWAHWGFVYDAGSVRVYRDGFFLGSAATRLDFAGVNLEFGSKFMGTWGVHYDGWMDEFALFGEPLSQDDLALLARGTRPDEIGSLLGAAATDIGPLLYDTVPGLYVRTTFEVDDPSDYNSLILSLLYDDGYVAYLNGTDIARSGAPEPLAWNSAATQERSAVEALSERRLFLPSSADLLRQGTNVLAFHALNVSAADGDFLLAPRLVASKTELDAAFRHFSTPTPGLPNGITSADRGPILANLAHFPNVPASADPITVGVYVRESVGSVTDVTLHYRAMFGPETSVPMYDDGEHGDGAAGDGVYAATIPAGIAASGQMIRYRVTATDSRGDTSREPLFPDPTESPEYAGTIVLDAAIDTQLPVLHWFVQNASAADTRAGTRGSVFFDGEFYDNIFIRVRGVGSSTYPKPSHKFEFNDGHWLRYADDRPRVDEFNLDSTWGDASYLREHLAYTVYETIGSHACVTFPLRTHRNGAFYGVDTFIEQIDETYLERNGLDPNGALYKMYNSLSDPIIKSLPRYDSDNEKKTRLFEDYSDIAELVAGVDPSLEDRSVYLFDNIDIPGMLTYLAGHIVIQDLDHDAHNYYMYRDSEGNGEWIALPHDRDFCLGVGTTANDDPGSHPFFGCDDYRWPRWVELPDNDNQDWNRLTDAILDTPVLREMFLRRLRTAMDQVLQPPGTPYADRWFEGKIDALYAQMAPDVALDAAKWGRGSFSSALNYIKSFLETRRVHLYYTHGLNVSDPSQVLIDGGAAALAYVPKDDSLGDLWKRVQTIPNTSQWTSGTTGVGFEVSQPSGTPSFLPEIGIDVLDAMFDTATGTQINTSVYVAVPFVLTPDKFAGLGDTITLQMKYDDGFVAYLNGVEIARANAPATLAWNSAATASHADTDALQYVSFPVSLSAFRTAGGQLIQGTNTLAIHGLNQSGNSSDCLISPRLINGTGTGFNPDSAGIPPSQVGNPQIVFASFDVNPASGDQDEEYIELVNPNATAVDISGWRLSGDVSYTFREGVVIPAGGSLYVSPNVVAFRSRVEGPSGGQGLFVQGGYAGYLPNVGGTLQLIAMDGETVASVETPYDPSIQQEGLRITEINYHPAAPSPPEVAAGFVDKNDFEFIELLNVSDRAFSLEGVRFNDGIEFDFTGSAVTALAPGEFVLVVRNSAAFTMRYGSDLSSMIAGEYEGRLSNGGEHLSLIDAGDGVICAFEYDDEGDWPASADGQGSTLQIIDVQGDYGDPLNWKASDVLHGTPGRLDFLPGDADGDGFVGSADLDIIRAHWGLAVAPGDRASGDLSGDGIVGSADLDLVRAHWGSPAAAPAESSLSPRKNRPYGPRLPEEWVSSPPSGEARAAATEAAFAQWLWEWELSMRKR